MIGEKSIELDLSPSYIPFTEADVQICTRAIRSYLALTIPLSLLTVWHYWVSLKQSFMAVGVIILLDVR